MFLFRNPCHENSLLESLNTPLIEYIVLSFVRYCITILTLIDRISYRNCFIEPVNVVQLWFSIFINNYKIFRAFMNVLCVGVRVGVCVGWVGGVCSWVCGGCGCVCVCVCVCVCLIACCFSFSFPFFFVF